MYYIISTWNPLIKCNKNQAIFYYIISENKYLTINPFK